MAQRNRQSSTANRAVASWRNGCVVACFLMALCSSRASAQTSLHFGHQAWTTEDGLPQNSIHQTLQTRDGYLWIATEGGLARFDGLNFTVFRREDQPDFPSDDIACLAEDTTGALWIGTTDGLLRYNGGHFSQVSLGAVPGPPSVISLAAAQDGSVLALTAGGIVHIVDGHATPLEGAPTSIATLSAAPGQTVWITAGSSLLQYSQGRLLNRGHLSSAGTPLEVQIDRSGAIWLRSSSELFSQNLSQLAVPSRDRASRSVTGLASIMPLVTTFFYDDAGSLWLGTRHGLFVAKLPGGAPVQVAEIGDRSVLSISRDREGDLWIGTEADGLHILRSQKVEQISGLGDHLLTALTQTGDGTLWIGTRDDGLRVYKAAVGAAPAAAYTPKLAGPLTSQLVLSLAAGTHDDVWVGTLDGLDHIDRGRVDRYSSADGLPDDVIRSLLVDRDGSLWIGTRRGLVHWRGTRGTPFRPIGALPGQLIGAMLSESLSQAATATARPLWVATLDGLSRIQGDPANPTIQSYKLGVGSGTAVITSLAEDASGTLWIGTRSHGLAALTASGVQSLPSASLPKNINSLLTDTEGHLWMGTPRGIFRGSLEDLRHCLTHSDCAPSVARFGYADGMPTEETTASGHPAAIRAQDGRLWFATAKGIAALNPGGMHETTVAPAIVIERFLVDNQSQSLAAQPLRLPFGHTSLTVEYVGLSFAAPSRVRYRYRLEGFDPQWTEAGVRRTAFYTNLPPGSYTFRVQAANSDGVWNRAGADLAFTILPPFYRRTLFYALVVLALASLAYAIYYLRVRRLRSQFDAVLAERGRIAREIHDTLAQNFVGISIQLQIAEQLLSLNNPAAIGEQLRQTRALVQEGLDDARQSIWELRASVAQDSLPTRIARAAERAAREEVRQQVKIGGIYRPLDAGIEKEVLRIAQEALANVTRHARATEVKVELRYESDRLQLAVMDNGSGFDPDAVSSVDDHFGLQGMRERAAALAATLSVTSSPGDGTSVCLTVPLPRSERRSS